MDIVSLIIIIVVVGVLLWAVNSFIPMDAKIKQILNVIVVIVLLLWLVSVFLGGSPAVDLNIRR